jgi:hypothetical protein
MLLIILKEKRSFSYINEGKIVFFTEKTVPSREGRIFILKNPKVFGIFIFGHLFLSIFQK